MFYSFCNNEQYDYLFAIDGDDFLYPTAFQHIETYINSKNPDILMLMYHDILSKNTNNSSTHLLINNKFNFNYNIVETTNDIWLKVKSKNPFEHNINKLNTIGRVLLFSRNSMKFNLHYDVNCKLYDDFI